MTNALTVNVRDEYEDYKLRCEKCHGVTHGDAESMDFMRLRALYEPNGSMKDINQHWRRNKGSK